MTSVEQWRPVVGWNDLYEVSDAGRVRGIDRVIRERTGVVRRIRGRVPRTSTHGTYGHRKVSLSRDSHAMTRTVHQLVLEAFLGSAPDGTEACHGPEGAADNRLTNLRWDTKSSNIIDSVRDGTHRNSRKTADPLGHLLIKPNLRAASARDGERRCLACQRAHSREQKALRAGRPFDFQTAADMIYVEIMSRR